MSDAAQTRQRLLATLEKVRKSVGQVRGRKEHIGETQTKASLINPVLQALGWDITDLDEVALEYRHKPQDNPVDYALFSLHKPHLFVEAKALDTNLSDHKWVSQTVNYANAAGVAWCVLTDGDKWAIYNTHAPVAVEQKLFRTVTCTDTSQEAHVLESLELLSKEQLSGNTIEDLWKAYFVDCSVERVVRELVDHLDPSFVSLIRKRAPALMPAEIRESLKRADLRLEFPVLAPSPVTPPDSTFDKSEVATVKGETWATGSRVRVQHLLDAGLVKAGDKWRCSKGKGAWVYAEVTAEGNVLLEGSIHDSPSAAGKAVTGWTSFDGWKYWQYRDTDGNWAPIGVLREQLARLGKPNAAATSQATPARNSDAQPGHVFRWLLELESDGSFVLDCRYLPDETKSFEVSGRRIGPEKDFRPARKTLFTDIYTRIKPLFPDLPDGLVRAKAWSGVHKVYPAKVYGGS